MPKVLTFGISNRRGTLLRWISMPTLQPAQGFVKDTTARQIARSAESQARDTHNSNRLTRSA